MSLQEWKEEHKMIPEDQVIDIELEVALAAKHMLRFLQGLIRDWERSEIPHDMFEKTNFSRGADDSFYDYIPGGLDVVVAIAELGLMYYGSDEAPKLKEALQKWITENGDHVYWTGDCSSNALEVLKWLIQKFQLEPTTNLQEDLRERE